MKSIQSLTRVVAISAMLFASMSFKPIQDVVYVCNSKNAAVYHSSMSCRGIKNCTHQITQMSVSDAVNNYHLRSCKICFK